MKKIIQISFLLTLVVVFGFKVENTTNTSESADQPEFHVALMLPLFLHNASRRRSDSSKVVYDYYEGVQMALTDLQKSGMKLTLHVYDTEADSTRVDSFFRLPELRSMNTIVGPVYPSIHSIAERFCGITKIPLISPFKNYERAINDTFPHINLVASDSILAFGEGQAAGRLYSNHKLIIVSDGIGDNYKSRKLFREGFSLVNNNSIKVVNQNDLSEIYAQSKTTNKILVYAPIDSVDILKKLVNLGAAGKVKLLIPKNAKRLSGFAKSDLMRGKVIFGDNNYYDKYADDILVVRKRYREQFKWELNSWQFRGYDQFMWLGQSLMTFKQTYPSQLGTAFYSGLMQQFCLKPTVHGGYDNAGCKLIYYNSKGIRVLANP